MKHGPITHRTGGGVVVHCAQTECDSHEAVERLIDQLDGHRGALLTSTYEYPGRYSRWDLGFVDPPLAIEGRERTVIVSALNERGAVLLDALVPALAGTEAVESIVRRARELTVTIARATFSVPEEQRSRQPSTFSLLRSIVRLFQYPDDHGLGLYGALGYDLAFQFEPIRLRLERSAAQRDLVLYLPDEITIVDHQRQRAHIRRYEFEVGGRTTAGLPRAAEATAYRPARRVQRNGDHDPGEYEAVVRTAREAFARGDLFEVVPSQTFYRPCLLPPSAVFRQLRAANPAPYGFLLNLGSSEYLVGASPEMYVRVDGDRVETCPIAGTIARGLDPLDDARQIARLLASAKDESELTMCTDVDRNDKSRICRPGTVRVLGRRQIEMYSRLIHTVDHIEGRLRDGFDALDAFLSHMWAVTVTGAPKIWAMQFIEDHERSPRAFYGGAVGVIGFDGHLNTGLTLRTIRIRDGVAEVRAGATLLFESDEAEEERETRLKASALLGAIEAGPPPARSATKPSDAPALPRRRVLLVDHQDSFVHTLADYFRQTGAEVVTMRVGTHLERLVPDGIDLVVLSPGPGRPADFGVVETIATCVRRKLPVFGVCLGLQGMIEAFGGRLALLPTPVHGKPARVRVLGGRLFEGLPPEFVAGRYHSLHALRDCIPDALRVTAETEDGVVMAIEHRTLPLWAVQFHPESMLTSRGQTGHRLVENVVSTLCGQGRRVADGTPVFEPTMRSSCLDLSGRPMRVS